MSALKTFGPNELGRDIVIGDLHGSLTCLDVLLKGLNFDPTKDRLFSVGDLVDRGEDSLGALRLLNQPWFAAVLANHEDMMLNAYTGDNDILASAWLANGGRWGMELWMEFNDFMLNKVPMSEAAQELMTLVLEKVKHLPMLITINHKNGKKFHIIHAELPFAAMEEQITDEHLADEETVRYLCSITIDRHGIEKSALWRRHLFMRLAMCDPSNVRKQERVVRYTVSKDMPFPFSDKLSHIISGHTPMRGPITVCGATNIDTKAYGAKEGHHAGLTAVVLDDWTFWRANLTECAQVQELVFDMELELPGFKANGN
jgi:serine/threonine protein phosphatase 1